MFPALFWYLQAQPFYQSIHRSAIDVADLKVSTEIQWADIGCGIGLMSRVAYDQGYRDISSYDLEHDMIRWAKFINRKNSFLTYEQKDIMDLNQKFDVISATSLLSVVPERSVVLEKLISLLKNRDSKLILIEPTEKMHVKNVWRLLGNLKELYYYKMLFVWARARQGKAVDEAIFNDVKNVSHHYLLNDMVRITIIGKQDEHK